MNLTLQGSGFTPDSSLEFSGSGVIVQSVRLLAPGVMQASVVLSGAPGAYAVRIVDGSGNSAAQSFTIVPTALGGVSILDVDHYAGADGGVGSRDGAGPHARFYEPSGVWGDSEYLYISDTENHTIRRMTISSGETVTIAGNPGQAGAVDGPSTSARFNRPTGVWGGGGFLYIADAGNAAIRQLHLGSGNVATIAGLPGAPGASDGAGSSARFTYPTGIWGAGTVVYIADAPSETSRTLRRLNLASGDVTTIVNLGEAPAGEIFVDMWGSGDRLWIADSGNHVIWELNLASFTISRLAGESGIHGTGDGPGDSAHFNAPRGIWGDGAFLYVADTGNHTIRRIDIAAKFVTTLAGQALVGGWIDAAGGNARFGAPVSIWQGGDSVFVAEQGNHAIRRIQLSDASVTTPAGRPPEHGSIDGAATQARFALPFKAWADASNLYITDHLDSTVRKMSLSNGQVTTLAGSSGNFGHVDGAAAQTRLGHPFGVWADGQYVYVTDGYFDTVRRIATASGETMTFAGSPAGSGHNDGVGTQAQFRSPAGIWGDGEYLYVADSLNFTVRRITIQTREVVTFAGSAEARGTADGVGASARFYAPGDIWGDGVYLYVADGHAIRRITIANAKVETLAGAADLPDFSDGAGTGARFSFIGGIWGDGLSLFVADSGNNLVRRVALDTGFVHTLAGFPMLAGSENGIGNAARFLGPSGIAGDGTSLYILDSLNFKIRRGRAPHGTEPASSQFTFLIGEQSGVAPVTTGAPETVQTGYGRITPAPGSGSPSGIAIFGFNREGVLVSEASVAAAPAVWNGRIYAEMKGAANTGLAIANPNPNPVVVSYYFTVESGATVYWGQLSIPAYGQVASFLDQAPFAPPSTLQIDLSQVRTFTFSASEPVAVTALRGFINERSEFLMTALPVASLHSTGSSPIVFPHFAVGGGWTTRILLVNPTDTPLNGVVDFFTPNTAGGQSASEPYTVAPRSAAVVHAPAGAAGMNLGWASVTPFPGTVSPSGLLVFSYQENGITVSETGMTAEAQATAFRLYAENSGNFSNGEAGSIRTGLAISNAAPVPAMVQFELLDLDGESTGQYGWTSIPANSQIPMFLDQIPGFTNVPAPFKGILRISGAPVAVVGLRARYNERGEFMVATTPPVPETSSAAAIEKFFAHFADGGGYTTQFILFSGAVGQVLDGTLKFVGSSGEAMALPLRD